MRREKRQSHSKQLFKKTWEKKILILLITFLCTAASLVYSLFVVTPRYDSTAKVSVVSQGSKEYKEMLLTE